MKNGAYVRITGHSDVADTVEFTVSTGAQKDAAVLNQQGIAKQNLGDWDGAMADYNEAIRLDPNYSEESLVRPVNSEAAPVLIHMSHLARNIGHLRCVPIWLPDQDFFII